MPKVVEIYKEVKQFVKVKEFRGADANANAAEYLNCSTELIRNAIDKDLKIVGSHKVKTKFIRPRDKDIKSENTLKKRAEAMLFRYRKELDCIKGKVIEELGMDDDAFHEVSQNQFPVTARQGFSHLAYGKLRENLTTSIAIQVIACYLGKHRTTIIHALSCVEDEIEMPFNRFKWVKKIKL